jgi:hypothetical protein
MTLGLILIIVAAIIFTIVGASLWRGLSRSTRRPRGFRRRRTPY